MLRLTASLLVAGLAGTPVFAADPPAKEGSVPLMNSTQAINFYIAEGWEKAGIKKPAEKATDLEFHRRLFLDLLGRIPTVAEVLDFEADRSATKRAKLVRRLLYGAKNEKGEEIVYRPVVAGKATPVDSNATPYTQQYSEHWATMWTIWLMSRTTHVTYREQMQSWLANKFEANIPHDELVKLLISADGATNKNGAVNFVLHHLGEKPTLGTDPGFMDAVPITSRITRLFTGLQTQCTQCHDHPFNKEWVQGDFWGVNAYFRQTRRNANPTPRPGAGNNNNMMAFAQVTLSDEDTVNKESRVFFERRDGKLMSTKPTFLKDYAQAEKGETSTRKLPADMAGKTRRQLLAEYVVQHDNFGKAYVNRMWGHLFGRGLNKEPTIDDFGSHNEVVHPELLEKLAGDFKQYGYDSKALLEAMCNSDVYGLSHVANKDYAADKYNPYFARMPLKALSPEVLHASLSQATKSDEEVVDKKVRGRNRENWLEKLVRNFGDDEGNELTFNGTVVQALLMMNGTELNTAIMKKGSNVVESIMAKHKKLQGKAFSSAVIDDLFLTTVSRHATPKELAALIDVQDGIIVPKRDEPPKTGTTPPTGPTTKPPVTTPVKPPVKPPVAVKPPGGKPAPKVPGDAIVGVPATDAAFYQDVFWALMNTTEFMLNH